MKNKIFEKIEWVDGGPNDKGVVVGYYTGESETQLKEKFKINHNFVTFREISKKEYLRRKELAKIKLSIFNLQI